MADKKLSFALLNQFKKRLTARGLRQDINMFTQRWTASDLIDSFGYDDCLAAIDWYFKVNKNPQWTWYSYNTEKLLAAMRAEAEDIELRAALREGAKKWLAN